MVTGQERALWIRRKYRIFECVSGCYGTDAVVLDRDIELLLRYDAIAMPSVLR